VVIGTPLLSPELCQLAPKEKGKDPVLPENRAGACNEEFEQISRSWTTLFGPHMKKTTTPSKAGKS